MAEIYVGVEDSDFPLPLDADDMTDLAREGRMIPRPLPSTVPAEVQRLCSRCFEQDPSKRASARGLLKMVDEWWAKVDV